MSNERIKHKSFYWSYDNRKWDLCQSLTLDLIVLPPLMSPSFINFSVGTLIIKDSQGISKCPFYLIV